MHLPPPPCFDDQKELKMEIGISRQYISTDKYQSLVEVNIMILNMIHKLGYTFLFKFWSWIPLTAVIYHAFLCILGLLGVFLDC